MRKFRKKFWKNQTDAQLCFREKLEMMLKEFLKGSVNPGDEEANPCIADQLEVCFEAHGTTNPIMAAFGQFIVDQLDPKEEKINPPPQEETKEEKPDTKCFQMTCKARGNGNRPVNVVFETEIGTTPNHAKVLFERENAHLQVAHCEEISHADARKIREAEGTRKQKGSFTDDEKSRAMGTVPTPSH